MSALWIWFPEVIVASRLPSLKQHLHKFHIKLRHSFDWWWTKTCLTEGIPVKKTVDFGKPVAKFAD